MKQTLIDSKNSIELNDEYFGAEFSPSLVHQALVAHQAGGRQGSAKQKSRAEVSGGGKKPWRQKGTGNARAGSTRSPIWRTGGVTFAAKPRNYDQKMNKKMYRRALRSIVSELIREGRLLVCESFALEAPKTKQLNEKLSKHELDDVLIVTIELEDNLYLASRNLHKVGVCDVTHVDPVSLVGFGKTLFTQDAIKAFEARLA